MIGRISAAAMRGFLMALLIATPALMVPGVVAEATQLTVLVALILAIMTFVEYTSNSPSIIEFRDAPPYNRMRFAALALMVFSLSALVQHHTSPSVLSGAITSIGVIVGHALDFPYSPVRLVILMLPDTADPQKIDTLRTASGLAYLICATTILSYLCIVRLLGWPTRNGAFNVWVNLPLFDPTSGGDVLFRLQRDARLNIAVGILLPFLIPAMVKFVAPIMPPVTLGNPQTLIWTLSVWAFLPTSMIMRGIAMGKVASLILDKRRRVYASEHAKFQPA